MRKFLFFLPLVVFWFPELRAERAIEVEISRGELGEFLASDGMIAKIPAGALMQITFDYNNPESRLHPYLIADRFCSLDTFMKWGRSSSPVSTEYIRVLCVKRLRNSQTEG